MLLSSNLWQLSFLTLSTHNFDFYSSGKIKAFRYEFLCILEVKKKEKTHSYTHLFISWWAVLPLLVSWSLFFSCFQSPIISISPLFSLYIQLSTGSFSVFFSSAQTSPIKSIIQSTSQQINKQQTALLSTLSFSYYYFLSFSAKPFLNNFPYSSFH